MGIYDRDYYRGEGSGYLERLIPPGTVCKWLIILNVGVFIVQMITRDNPVFTSFFVLDTQAVWEGQVWRLLTYAFLHDTGTFWHILMNMVFLWWFGSDLESMYGAREFLAFYLTAAFLGGITFTGFQALNGERALCLGASGAVTAIMVLFAFHFPSYQILLFFFLPVPIWFLVLFQVVQDAFIFLNQEKTTTAVTVHLAGAVFGFLYYKKGWHLLGFWDAFRSWRKQRARPHLRVFRPEDDKERDPVPVTTTPQGLDQVDEHLEAKLDAVLAKVARSGQASLTDKERQILLRASEIYKRKRT